MIDQELSRVLPSSLSSDRERLPTTPPDRIVVFGSRTAGVYNLSDGLLSYMRNLGIPNPVVEPIRDITNIDSAFHFATREDAENQAPPNLPRGVVLLPEMRDYSDLAARTVDPYNSGVSEHIVELCRQNGVPLVQIIGNYTPERLEAALRELAQTTPGQLPQGRE